MPGSANAAGRPPESPGRARGFERMRTFAAQRRWRIREELRGRGPERRRSRMARRRRRIISKDTTSGGYVQSEAAPESACSRPDAAAPRRCPLQPRRCLPACLILSSWLVAWCTAHYSAEINAREEGIQNMLSTS